MKTKSKSLKFEKHLVPLVLTGEKYTTWRLWDDKDLKTGDIVDFIRRPELDIFAKVKLIKVVEKSMSRLTENDKKGHESFESESQMYEHYSQLYKKPVSAKTPIKIIRFKLLKTYLALP